MAKRGKFEKLGTNEAYFETHADEKAPEQEKKHEKKVKQRKKHEGKFLNMYSRNVPEQLNPSTRFRYTKEKRKEQAKSPEKASVSSPERSPLIYMLCVTVLVMAASFILSSQSVLSMTYEKAATLKAFLMVGAYLVPTVVYIVSSPSRRKFYNIRPFSPSVIPMTLLCLGLVSCLALLQKYFITYMFSYNMADAAASQNLAVAIITGALVPAVCEEIFVRGVLQYEISKYGGGVTGIVICALVFGIMHFDARYFVMYLSVGLILGVLTHVTHSVFPAMIVHFLNNTVSYLISDKLSFIALWRISGTLFMIILAVLCFIFLIFMLRRIEIISLRRSNAIVAADTKNDYESEEESEPANPETDPARLFTATDKRTPLRFFKVMVSPYVIAVAAVFLIAVLVKNKM